MHKLLVVSSFVFCFFNYSDAQNTIRVPSEYMSIQAALDVAEKGTTILVAPGTYFENLVWPIEVDGIKLQSEAGPDETIIDGGGTNRVIVMIGGFTDGTNPQTISNETEIIGFTIQNGYAIDNNGAGMYISAASPTLENLIVKNNLGEGVELQGGGAYVADYTGTIKNCQFLDNDLNTGLRSFGTGLFLEARGDVSIEACLFNNNHGNATAWCYGGGLYLDVSLDLTITPTISITNCTINRNSTTTENRSFGGGIYVSVSDPLAVTIDSCIVSNNTSNIATWSHGGGIYNSGSVLIVKNSDIIGNSAKSGGGIHYNSTGIAQTIPENQIVNSKLSYNKNLAGNISGGAAIYAAYDPIDLTLENCQIDHNAGTSIVFNVSANTPDQAKLNLYNCTLAFNEGPVRIEATYLTLSNSILWNNLDHEIHSHNWGGPNIVDASYSIIQGGYNGTNIIDSDPLFIDENVLIPSSNSPCLSAGTSINSSATDLLGNPRPMPANSNPDLGCYEIDRYFAHVYTQFYYDENENGLKDNSERYLSFGSVRVNGEKTYNNFRPEGIFLTVEQGHLAIRYDSKANQGWQDTNQKEHVFTVGPEGFAAKIEIGLYPEEPHSNLGSFLKSGRFRCGEEVAFALSIINYGTVVESSTAYLQLDQRIEEYNFSIQPDYIGNDNTVGWNIKDLYPHESETIQFIVTAPLIEDASQVGELYTFKYNIENNFRQAGNCYETELRYAFDPNDKLVTPNRADQLALIAAPLFYTIRFQNTGNDYAKNVSVVDKLDENLDLQTFKVISTSHPEKLNVIFDDEQTVIFDFSNIYLPDSTSNEPGSNGFVSYSIEAIDGLELESQIKNTANIYFDFNPAIVTNTTNNIMVDTYPSSDIDESQTLTINIYPNPAKQVVQFSKTVEKAVLIDLNGKIVRTQKATNSLNLEGLPSELYLIELIQGNKSHKEKLVIKQ